VHSLLAGAWTTYTAAAAVWVWPSAGAHPNGALDVIVWWELHRAAYDAALLLLVVVAAMPSAVACRFGGSLLFGLLMGMGMQLIFGAVSQRLRSEKLYYVLLSAYQGPYYVAGEYLGQLAALYVSIVLTFFFLFIVPANLWYTFGWVVELAVRAVFSDASPALGALMFRAGLAFSVVCVVAAFILLFGQSALAALPRPLLYVVWPPIWALTRLLGPVVRFATEWVILPVVGPPLRWLFKKPERADSRPAGPVP
jgi:hypothetical protein